MMGVEIIRVVVKAAAVLFFLGGAVYFFTADNWLSRHTKMAGIILVSLLIIMLGGMLAIMMIIAN